MNLHLIGTGEYSDFRMINILDVPEDFDPQAALQEFVRKFAQTDPHGEFWGQFDYYHWEESHAAIVAEYTDLDEAPEEFWEAYVGYLVRSKSCRRVEFTRDHVQIQPVTDAWNRGEDTPF